MLGIRGRAAASCWKQGEKVFNVCVTSRWNRACYLHSVGWQAEARPTLDGPGGLCYAQWTNSCFSILVSSNSIP
jgi:hypothetical protein